MKRKKKKGSTLIVVLAVAIFALTVGATLMTTMMGTTEANQKQKKIEDLEYAAESGIEIARSHFNTPAGSDYKINTIAEDAGLVAEMIYTNDTLDQLKVESKPITENGIDKILVTSEATYDGMTETMKYKLIPGGSGKNALEYGVVASQGGININSDGPSNFQSTEVSVGTGMTITPPGLSLMPEKVDINKFNLINFNDKIKKVNYINVNLIKDEESEEYKERSEWKYFDHDDSMRFLKFEEVDLLGEVIGEIEPKYLEMDIKHLDKIKYKKNDNSNGNDGGTLKIEEFHELEKPPVIFVKIKNTSIYHDVIFLLINSDTVNLNIGAGAMTLNDRGVITGGNIKGTGIGSIKIHNTTLYGKDVKLDFTGAMHVTYQTAKKEYWGNVKKENLDEVNNLLSIFMPNWNTGAGSESSGIIPDENPYS